MTVLSATLLLTAFSGTAAASSQGSTDTTTAQSCIGDDTGWIVVCAPNIDTVTEDVVFVNDNPSERCIYPLGQDFPICFPDPGSLLDATQPVPVVDVSGGDVQIYPSNIVRDVCVAAFGSEEPCHTSATTVADADGDGSIDGIVVDLEGGTPVYLPVTAGA